MSAEWIKRVEEAVDEAKLIPLWGSLPAFPWDGLQAQLAEALQLPKLRLEVETTSWKKPGEFLLGLQQDPQVLTLELAPLAQPAFFAMPQEDAGALAQFCLSKTGDAKGFSHPDLQAGFARYIFLEVLDTLNTLHCFGDLSVRLGHPVPLPHEAALCLDLALSIGQQKVRARVICPSSFHEAFRTHFALHKPELTESPLIREVLVPLRLEIGTTQLSLEKWRKVEKGDLVILDRCTFDPEQQKGGVAISLGKIALFQGRIKDNQLKFLDYALTYEETMSPPEEESEPAEVPSEEAEQPLEEAPQEISMEKVLPADEVPLTLTVELGHLSMSLEKLLQIKPGNLLELGVSPEQGVALTLQGKSIARGELVKVGELLGVRITSIKR